MDPLEKSATNDKSYTTTLGELISYYYDKYSQIYGNSPELRDLAVQAVLDDILTRNRD